MKDNIGTIGITDVAAEALGDVVFVELPAVGRVVAAGLELLHVFLFIQINTYNSNFQRIIWLCRICQSC